MEVLIPSWFDNAMKRSSMEPRVAHKHEGCCMPKVLTKSPSLQDPGQGVGEGASAGFPNPLIAVGSKFRKELDSGSDSTGSMPCPTSRKRNGFVGKRKQTQKASWASNSS